MFANLKSDCRNIKHGGHIFLEILEMRKGSWAFFLDRAFPMLIGWADRSRGSSGVFNQLIRLPVAAAAHGDGSPAQTRFHLMWCPIRSAKELNKITL